MVEIAQIRGHLAALVEGEVAAAIRAGDLPDVAVPGASIERPKDAANGDYASTLPLRLARAAMKPPLEIAAIIQRHIPADATIAPVEVAPPGFLNFRLSTAYLQEQVDAVAEVFG